MATTITIDDILTASQLAPYSKDSWADFLLGLEKNITYLNSSVAPTISGAWQGTAAQLATGSVSASASGLLDSASKINTVQGIVEDFNDQLNGWATDLIGLTGQVAGNGLGYEQDGTVTIPLSPDQIRAFQASDPVGWQQLTQTQSKLEREIKAVLAEAEKVDDQTAQRLRQQLPALSDSGLTVDASQLAATAKKMDQEAKQLDQAQQQLSQTAGGSSGPSAAARLGHDVAHDFDTARHAVASFFDHLF